jgi:small-conductance mechanosensitive channel
MLFGSGLESFRKKQGQRIIAILLIVALCGWSMGSLGRLPYPIAILGTIAAIVASLVAAYIGRKIIESRNKDHRERYRKRQVMNTVTLLLALVAIVILWAHLLTHTGTFLGLLAAGLAIALKEPLLAIAGRIAILGGRLYSVGDRIEIDKVKGDVIDVGFLYTRMMELGNWIAGDQASGRIVQFSNSKLFGETVVYNYTRNFRYIWDEIMLPITYASNMTAATDILLKVGETYTQEFLEGAQSELERMKDYFLVPNFEVKPQVYVQVTSNWVQLTMRYVVDPKKRRLASSFIFTEVFKQVQGRGDITIASQTMDIAVHETATESSSSDEAERSKDRLIYSSRANLR